MIKNPAKPAILGGKPVLKQPLKRFLHNINQKEIGAVLKVLKKGPLSGFIAAPGPKFLGGSEVKSLEKLFCQKFRVKKAVAFNSASTALQAAVRALEIGPGDEVIMPPYTMSASASAVLANGAVPIFADIDEKTFTIEPCSIKEKISPRTKAIMAVNLFGGPADFEPILKIAQRHRLKIIEDNAQAPGAKYRGKYTGTIGALGVFSFNIHKVIQSGEGGVLTTNNKDYSFRAQLVRNHGEVVLDKLGQFQPILGSNFRPTEIESAIAAVQLTKLDFFNKKRIFLAKYLTEQLKNIKGLEPCFVEKGNQHVYYLYPIKINEKKLGISRKKLTRAMLAEGFPLLEGYVKPLYLMSIFQKQRIFKQSAFPFQSKDYSLKLNYQKGLCPVCERMFFKELILTDICQHPHTKKEIDLFTIALKKVLFYKKQL